MNNFLKIDANTLLDLHKTFKKEKRSNYDEVYDKRNDYRYGAGVSDNFPQPEGERRLKR